MRKTLVLVAALAPIAFAAAQAKPLTPPNEESAERTETMCKLNAQELGKTGKAFDGEVKTCIKQQSPDLAYWETCRQAALQRHLKGLELRNDVDNCMDHEP